MFRRVSSWRPVQALFFLLATWLGFMCQFVLIGAVYNKMRLGVPRDEGIVASPEASSRMHKDPNAAIDAQKTRSATDSPARGHSAGSSAPHPTPVEARLVLGACVAAAAAGTVVLRMRKHRAFITGVTYE